MEARRRVQPGVQRTAQHYLICYKKVVEIETQGGARGKALSVNVERGAGIFLQNYHSFLPARRI